MDSGTCAWKFEKPWSTHKRGKLCTHRATHALPAISQLACPTYHGCRTGNQIFGSGPNIKKLLAPVLIIQYCLVFGSTALLQTESQQGRKFNEIWQVHTYSKYVRKAEKLGRKKTLIDFRCQSILPLQCRNPTLQDVRIWLCITAYCFWALRNSLCHSSMVSVPGCIASYDRCALVMPYALVHDLTWPLLFGNILCFDAQFECDRCAWIVSVHWHITVRRAPMPNWALCTVA